MISVTVIGATGQQEKAYLLGSIKYRVGKQVGIYKFLYMQGSQKLLLRQDLLEQVDAKMKFNNAGAKSQTILTD